MITRQKVFDLAGVGLGPFNLSLAALSAKIEGLKTVFFEKKADFSWHPELMMSDVTMQTSFLKDLVTGVDPTSRYSFLNYLLEKQLLYSFLNTGRMNVSRQEFDAYGKWVAKNLANLEFSTPVTKVAFDGQLFRISTDKEVVLAQHICLGTGPVPNIPEVALPYLSAQCFHPKLQGLHNLDVTGKKVAIIGGGQTGAEILLHTLNESWGRALEVNFVSRRANLFPLDESPFVNEYFTPDYVRQFAELSTPVKSKVVAEQKLSSDGITEELLKELYCKLFSLKLTGTGPNTKILTSRELAGMVKQGPTHCLELRNSLFPEPEFLEADIVILATGFRHSLPGILSGIEKQFSRDLVGNIALTKDFEVSWSHMDSNHIFMQNFGRNVIGISEPQTSLMAWRSGKILNHLTGKKSFNTSEDESCFMTLGTGFSKASVELPGVVQSHI